MNATFRFDARGSSLGAALAAALALSYPAPVAGQAGAQADPADRSGRQVVEAQCVKCHAEGANGAPRIGDRGAWIPRLTRGVDALVGSAIHGHGGMPPRGGQADLTDAELRRAVLYMYDPAREDRGTMLAAARPAPLANGNEKLVDGLRIVLGFTPANAMRRFAPGSVERTMHGGVPRGAGYVHVNVSVLERDGNAPVESADVEVRAERLGMGGETKKLEPMALRGASYGGYLRVLRDTPYRLIVRVRQDGAPGAVEARFDHTF